MAFNASTLASAITSAQGTAANPTIQDDANLKLATGIINFFKAQLTISSTIPAVAITTNGSATIQVGPPAPVLITGSIP